MYIILIFFIISLKCGSIKHEMLTVEFKGCSVDINEKESKLFLNELTILAPLRVAPSDMSGACFFK